MALGSAELCGEPVTFSDGAQASRESARQVQCLSNLRQISTATLSYNNDNRGAYPGRAGRLRLDVAHGLRDGDTALSAIYTAGP